MVVTHKKIKVFKWITQIKYVYLSVLYTGKPRPKKVGRATKTPRRHNIVLSYGVKKKFVDLI